MGVSSLPNLNHVPVLKLPVGKESEYQAILASAGELGVLFSAPKGHTEEGIPHT